MKPMPGFFVAFRYLFSRDPEGGRYLRGAAIGIALSLIPIVVTLIVADGMIRGITDRYIELGTSHLQARNYIKSNNIETALTLLNNTDGVRGAYREQQSMGVIVGNGGRTGATIRAVDPEFWEDTSSRAYLTVIDGNMQLETDREILLGRELATTINAQIGDTVRIMTIRVTDDGRSIPRLTPFTVKGIISSGYQELDALWCIMTYSAGQLALPPELSTAYILIKINDPYKDADQYAVWLEQVLGQDFWVFTWKNLIRAQYSSYESTRQLLLFIMALIVMVAAVNVSSATSMLVIERQRDLAIFKACGAPPRFTSQLFIWGAFFTGLVGSIIGISLGLLVGVNINGCIQGIEAILNFFTSLFHGETIKILDPGFYLEVIPIIIDWGALTLIGAFTILSSMLASWIPAYRAGRIKPIEILRKY
ncbi:MAG: ABC transporter permease [Treponema sp.]|jgi:lipoprotein-releasing system permease protein|nr:ABC transporter permease [Treponema sp.]